MKKYRKDHSEESKAYSKQYRKDHREEIKKYRKDHREKIKQYHKDHREERLVYAKQYYKDHIEESKQYLKDHREERKAYNKKQWKKHSKERLAYDKKMYPIRRVKKILEIGNFCACCGLKDIYNLTIDHIISKAMKRKFKKYKNFDIEKPSNLQLLCWACNTSKNGHKKCCTLQHNNPKIKKMVTKARRQKSKK